MDPHVKAFCLAYEKANCTSDFGAIGNLYADTFLFAGPNAVKALRREDFLKVIPHMKARFAALGLAGTRLSSVDAVDLDAKYILVKAGWTMTLQVPENRLETFDAFATYIVQRNGDRLSIVFQLDHQDLASLIHDKTQPPPLPEGEL